jgi:UDP-2,3-diacylglucosamine pyrophosphatase LpxH
MALNIFNRKTHHTAVISDLHLNDAEPVHPDKPLWKIFKRREFFFDHSLVRFMDHLIERGNGKPVELVLNGDIFDFDSVMALPRNGEFKVTKLEKKIGLDSVEHKSLFKMKKIIEDHAVFFDGLKKFIQLGNKVVFVIGNHDIELYWPSVQKEIRDRITTESKKDDKKLIFCEWFYVSQNDTLIEHGHQYDPYCMCLDPINPIIKKNKKYKIRIPFGDLANRQILNTFALKNAHDDTSYVRSPWEFVKFFFQYELKVQPLLVFNWLFGAARTLYMSLSDGFTPALKDPLTHEARVKEIARRSNTKTEVISSLSELHAHPAVHNPVTIIRELFLDRVLVLLALIWGSWQFYTTFYWFANISFWWFAILALISIPVLAYYAQGIKSEINTNSTQGEKLVPIAAKIAGVNRVVHGHTHKLIQENIDGIEFFNPGTWSRRYENVECTKKIRSEHFVWIELNGDERKASLVNWTNIDLREEKERLQGAMETKPVLDH